MRGFLYERTVLSTICSSPSSRTETCPCDTDTMLLAIYIALAATTVTSAERFPFYRWNGRTVDTYCLFVDHSIPNSINMQQAHLGAQWTSPSLATFAHPCLRVTRPIRSTIVRAGTQTVAAKIASKAFGASALATYALPVTRASFVCAQERDQRQAGLGKHSNFTQRGCSWSCRCR